MRRISFGLALAASLVLASTTPSSAGQVVGPNQGFVGSVNGAFDSAKIQMACFGPIKPGQTGHPMAGQMLEVLSPPPPIAFGPIHPGNTGASATKIVAVLGGKSHVVLARFTRYFQAVAIARTAELPCAGSGVVRFVPKPASSTSKAAWVSVSFVGQP